MAKGGSSTTVQAQDIPAEVKPLYSATGTAVQQLQADNPISSYLKATPTKIAPLSGTQLASVNLMNKNLSDATTPLEESPIAQAGKTYFESSMAPQIENQATLAGLGRSTALAKARASAEGSTILPLLQSEQARRDAMIQQGMATGSVEQDTKQREYNAAQQDLLRRQQLAEEALFVPLGQLPNTFGNTTKTTSTPGGLFK